MSSQNMLMCEQCEIGRVIVFIAAAEWVDGKDGIGSLRRIREGVRNARAHAVTAHGAQPR